MRLVCLVLVLVGGAGCTAAGRAAFLGERWHLPSLRPQHASESDAENEDAGSPPEKEPLIAKFRSYQQSRSDPAQRRPASPNINGGAGLAAADLTARPHPKDRPAPDELSATSTANDANTDGRSSLASIGHTPFGSVAGTAVRSGTPLPRAVRSAPATDEGGPKLVGETGRGGDESKLVVAEQTDGPAEGRPGVVPAADEQSAEDEKQEPARPRRFPTMPDWDPARLWPSTKHDQAAAEQGKTEGSLIPRPSSRFPFPQIIGGNGDDEPAQALAAQPGDKAGGTAPADAKPASPSRPIDPDAQVWEEELRKLISLLEADATVLRPGMSQADQREYIRRQVALRMLYLVAGEPERAQQVIAGIPSAEQEFWTALFWGLSDYVDDEGTADPAERATLTIDQLRSAVHHLQTKARLHLQDLTFCRRINSFGSYERFDADEFSAGETVLLYCEVKNFQTEPTGGDGYQTRLKSSIEIYRDGPNGELVERNSFPATVDLSRTPRTDYFHSYRIDLPTHLAPGPYQLKLTVEDELSGKIATESIPLQVR